LSALRAIHKKVPEWKAKIASEIRELAEKYPVFLVLDLTGVPAKHIQMLRKKLNKIAIARVVKPRVAL
jgi:large subunit ribosomal protein L10